MITINQAKLQEVLSGYKKYFPTHISDEIYKWKAVKHFQDHWDIDAPDFLAMFWERNKKNSKQIEEADLQHTRANTDTASKDFLSMAKQLVDFYKAHKNIFATITLLNHSGNNNASWQKIITKRRPHIGKDGIPIYVETLNKKKEIDTDEKLELEAAEAK